MQFLLFELLSYQHFNTRRGRCCHRWGSTEEMLSISIKFQRHSKQRRTKIFQSNKQFFQSHRHYSSKTLIFHLHQMEAELDYDYTYHNHNPTNDAIAVHELSVKP